MVTILNFMLSAFYQNRKNFWDEEAVHKRGNTNEQYTSENMLISLVMKNLN